MIDTVPPIPPLIPSQAPSDSGGSKYKPVWSWLVGILIPIVFFASWIGFSRPGSPFGNGLTAAYLGALTDILLVSALWPMLIAVKVGIPYMVVEAAGFGLPSPLGLLLSGFVWMLIGRGLYVLYHSRLKIIFWPLILAAIGALGIGAYIGTGDFRTIEKAKETKNVSYCNRFEGEAKGYCLIDVAVAANDPSICENIPGFQRTACFRSLDAPYTPLPGMK
ncbi:MAG: hypothetical protein AAB463_00960 [Patescibacteria group bacterium]